MSEQTDTSNTEKTPFKSRVLNALERLFHCYDYHCDLEALLNETPIRKDEKEIEFVKRFLQNRGFVANLSKVHGFDLNNIKYPVLSETDGGGFALRLPVAVTDDTEADQLNNGNEDVLSESDRYYTGELIEIRPESADLFYADHIDKGHALNWFWDPITRYKRNYMEVIQAAFFINLFVLVIPLYSLNVYDRVVTNFAYDTLMVLTIGAGVALLFDFMFKNVRAFILEKIVENIGNDYDFKLMERLMIIDRNKISLSIGEKANMFRELQGIREFYAARLVPTLVDLPFILLFLGVIYMMSPKLCMVVMAICAIIVCLNLIAHAPISRMTKENFSSSQNKTGFLIETLSGIEEIKIHNAKSHRLFHWDLNVNKMSRSMRKNNFFMTVLSNLTVLISQTCHIAVIFFGVYQIEQGLLTIGGLITCTILSSRAIAPVINVSNLLARLQQTNDVLNAVDRVFKAPHTGLENKPIAAKGPFKGALTLSNISYTYPQQNKPALNNINLKINPGEKIGIIGKTAAGKSTLAKLMGGLIECDEGEIKLDDYEYGVLPTTELRRTVAYAPQEAFFFRGSVLYNITLGREDVDKETLQEAIGVSGLDIVMRQCGEGLDMDVGEMGCKLSGGQKQSLILARAIIRKPQVLIFDEPTNGMDSALESHVQQVLKNYIADKTFIMITHRTGLLSLTDRLALIDDGKIIADDTRDALLARLSKGAGNA